MKLFITVLKPTPSKRLTRKQWKTIVNWPKTHVTLTVPKLNIRLHNPSTTQKEYAAAEKELLNYIEQSTPHAYWLARSFILLSDVYHATGKDLDARQYLLSLQQNYQRE